MRGQVEEAKEEEAAMHSFTAPSRLHYLLPDTYPTKKSKAKMSMVRSKKVVDLHQARPEWVERNHCLWVTASDRRDGSWGMRQDAVGLRNEMHLQTQWDKYHNDVRLQDRITLVRKWKEVLEESKRKAIIEKKMLADTKSMVEVYNESLGTNLRISQECNLLRDGRRGYELVHDDSERELRKELDLVESIKTILTQRCQEAWQQDCRMEEELHRMEIDLADKTGALKIDNGVLQLTPQNPGVSFKPDPLRVPSKSVSPICWEEATRMSKERLDTEAGAAERLRNVLDLAREKAINDLRAQAEAVNYSLRVCIHESQKARNEMQWQRKKLQEEMDRAMSEIEALERALKDKEGPLKVAETRLEERTSRPGGELCRDEPQFGLGEQVLRLREAIQLLNAKLDQAKALYNAMEDQLMKIDDDIADKNHALETDLRVLDTRKILLCESLSDDSETGRNMQLFNINKELPPK
ncbi:tektin-B1 [Hetaerina americana]|uniref:tektin-B1 n=1 Tax=Hetaerina americana TaxID=62018 RepID=UPI003A7F4295